MFKQEDSQAGDSSAQDVHAEAEPSAILPARSPTSTAQIVLGHTGETQVTWTVSSKANPHLLMVGLSGMGKTEALLNIMRQMTAQGIVPIVLSYHPDIDQRMSEALGNVQLLTMNTLGYNPMIVTGGGPNAHVDNAGMLRDGFAAIWPDLGEVQLSQIRSAIKQSYEELGWRHAGADTGSNLALPSFGAFYEILRREKNPDRSLKTLLGRLEELDDYGILSSAGAARSLLSMRQPAVLSLHESGNENVQRALTMLALHGMYTDMFRRGVQTGLTHAIVVDEAHRASKLKWLVKFAKEGRKFGISLILASQSAADFQAELFSGIASYLLLRMTEQDATHLTKAIASSDRARGYADRLKRLDKYEALLFTEGRSQPDSIRLKPGS
jgi:thymidine kinase